MSKEPFLWGSATAAYQCCDALDQIACMCAGLYCAVGCHCYPSLGFSTTLLLELI